MESAIYLILNHQTTPGINKNADYEQYKEYCKAVDDQSEKAFTLKRFNGI